MPRKTIDKQTKKPISDKTIHRVFKTFCYDEQEGDCWQYRNAPQQDCFTERDYPARVKTAQHVLHNVTRAAAWNFIALQPPAIPPLSATCEVQKPACEKVCENPARQVPKPLKIEVRGVVGRANASKRRPKPNRRRPRAPKKRPRSGQVAPKSAQDAPKTAQEAPKRRPEHAHDHPR